MKIAIVRLSALGDIFQSMIVLQFIKSRYPSAQIDWFVDSLYEDALIGNRDIDNIISINLKNLKNNFSLREFFKLIKKLKSCPTYDYIFDLQGLLKSAIVSRFIPARNRVGFDKNSIRESVATLFYSKTFFIHYHENVIKRYIGIVNHSLNLKVTTEEILNKQPIFSYTKNTDITNRTCLIIIGASFESKIYPVEKFAKVINTIGLDFIVSWKTPIEREMAIQLVSLTNRAKLSEGLDISGLKSQVANSLIVIGGDTGPTHLAWAMNVPSITIFGPTPIERNFFRTEINDGIKSNSQVNAYKIKKNDFSIRDIHSDEICRLAKRILKL